MEGVAESYVPGERYPEHVEYKKSIYDHIGGFIDTAIFNEDMIYASNALKNGYMSYYRADAMVYHSHSYTPLKEFSRNFDLGVSQAMHPEVFGGIRSESEGVKLVLGTVKYLGSKGQLMEIPGEPGHVVVVQSRFDLIQKTEGRRFQILNSEQQGNRSQSFLPARELHHIL